MDLGIPDLTPQNQIKNLTGVLQQILGATYKYAKITKLDETEWLAYIADHYQEVQQVYSTESLDEEDRDKAVTWLQDGDFISITIREPRDQITVDESRITCSSLKGIWWGPVKKVTVDDVGDLTQINLDVDIRWPCLVRGGDPDPDSCCYLALVALELKQLEMCQMWLRHGAILQSRTCMRSYAMVLTDNAQWPEAIHWLTRCIISFQDHRSGYTLASVLLRHDNDFMQDARLAEFMLCRLCLEGFPEAYFRLGRLYLNGADGVNPEPEKARFLLSLAAIRFQDEEAARILETADFSGEKKEEEEEVKEEEEKERTSPVDVAIAGGIIAGIAAIGFTAFRYFRRR